MLTSQAYRPPPPPSGPDGFHHPSTEDELVELVRLASRSGRQLRVRGSAHSVPPAIGVQGEGPVRVMLDRYIGLTFDDEAMEVTVQAGCHLGRDPRDPTRSSTVENSLNHQLELRGWALPDLGGVSHQTVSGFLMTGSAGGTTKHAVLDCVTALRIIDGLGRVHDLRVGDALFDAALPSMGLLGIVSSITFRCVPRYDLIGVARTVEERAAPFETFGDGDQGLASFLERTEYCRMMWWPQASVRRIAIWEARRMAAEDYLGRRDASGAFLPKPYRVLGEGIRQPQLGTLANRAAQTAAGAFYDLLAWGDRLRHLRSGAARERLDVGRQAFSSLLLPSVIRSFVPVGTSQDFWDSWHRALPMDEQMSEALLPTEFTEIWIPLECTGEAMRALRAHYDRASYDATGPYICELYAAPASRGWLHPSYGRPSLRVDIFWFGRNRGDPRRGYFMQFWKLLQRYGYRLHWGKHLPLDPELGHRYLRQQFPKWDEFMSLRREFDPNGMFLTDYWRQSLGLDESGRSVP